MSLLNIILLLLRLMVLMNGGNSNLVALLLNRPNNWRRRETIFQRVQPIASPLFIFGSLILEPNLNPHRVQIDLPRQFISKLGLWIVILFKSGLQSLQLILAKGCSLSSSKAHHFGVVVVVFNSVIMRMQLIDMRGPSEEVGILRRNCVRRQLERRRRRKSSNVHLGLVNLGPVTVVYVSGLRGVYTR